MIFRSPLFATFTACCVAAVAGCSGPAEPVDATVASLEPIRGELTIGGETAAPSARIGPGQTLEVSAAGLGRLRLDSGSRLLLGPTAQLDVVEADVVEINGGRVFVQVRGSEQLELRSDRGNLLASDTAFSVEASDDAIAVYIVRGEVSYQATADGENARGLVNAGERLTLSANAPRVDPAVLWTDWTGGLARPGLGDNAAPAGVGTLAARVPDERGQARWPLVARRLDVRVQVAGDYAVTEVDQVFFNPASETVEGIYRFRVPQEAVLQRFAVDREGRLVDGYVRERAQAQQAYNRQVYRGSTDDPALLTWDAPGSYRARIYPIGAGETRRIVIRYAQWLQRPAPDGPRLYVYPMGGGERPPHIQEFSLAVDIDDAEAGRVRAGMEAAVEGDTVMLRRSDFEPRADFWLELFDGDGANRSATRAYRAPHTPPQRATGSRNIPNEADERNYFYLPIVLPTDLGEGNLQGAAGLDLVIVADISAATDRSRLELGRSVVESLTAHLGDDDRVAVVTSDLTIRAVGSEAEAPELGPATAERLETLLDGLARVPAGGATDLGAAVAAAAELLDPARPGAVVYVGDGAPTVGELGAEGLLQRMARLPNPVRLYAVGVGSSANLDLLAALTRGGGLALRVEDRSGAAEASLQILAHAGRRLAQRVTVDLGAGIDNSFPRGAVDVVLGDVLSVVGRVRGDVPTTVTVTGTVAGREFTREIQVDTRTATDATDLRLRWANERLRRLLLEGAGREAVAELGTRCGLITPFTSYYVPSAREVRQGGHSELLIDQPLLLDGHDRRVRPSWRTAAAETAVASLLFTMAGPAAVTMPGCWIRSESSDQEAPMQAEVEDWVNADNQDDEQGGKGKRHKGEEGQMGRQDSRRSDNRFGIKGPGDNPDIPASSTAQSEPSPDPNMARERPSGAAKSAGPRPATTGLDSLLNGATGGGAVDEDRESERAEARDSVARGGILAALGSESGSAGEPTSPFGPGSALGGDPENALGGLMGNQTGDSFGHGGLGMRGTGRGGGATGEGTIGLGNLNTIGHGGGGGSGSGYGRGGGGLRGRRASVPTIRTGTAKVQGSLSKEVVRRYIRRHINQIRYCYEQQLARRPDLAGRVAIRFVISPSGAVSTASVASSTLGSPPAEQCIARAVQRIAFPQPEGGGVVIVTYPFMFQSAEDGSRPTPAPAPEPEPPVATSVTTTTVTTTVTRWDQRLHRPRLCSDSASQPLSERRALWDERLGAADGVSGWVRVYNAAIRRCEAPTWRDRRTLLGLIVARAGSVSRMIAVYQAMRGAGPRQYLRSAIFRRVRTPADLRQVRQHFGVSSSVDWELVNRILERATSVNARIRLLRQLLGLYPRGPDITIQYPHNFDLKLRLLAALEEANRLPEARRLAHDLRSDPLADAGVRTAVGEMYLRMGNETEARRVFSEIVEFAPYDGAARRRLGDLYRAHGWFEEAYRQYQTLAEIRPDDATVSLLLAQAAAGAGRTDEAIRLEQSLAETAQPGAAGGLARVAILWSSVRFAKLRKAAHEASDSDRLRALLGRMRRSGVLREAGAMRISLTWSHPDAGLSLWVAHPGLGLTRPTDIAPEFGLEAFDLREAQGGNYRIEVRRQSQDMRTPVEAELVIVWNEGQADERIVIETLRFEGDRRGLAWTLEGQALTEAELSAAARGEVR